MITKQFFFTGRVQGVGFRYSTKRLAMGFDVIGWVRNLDDGRVELQVQGEEDEVDAFLEEIHDSPLDSYIQEQQERTIAPLENVTGFSIT